MDISKEEVYLDKPKRGVFLADVHYPYSVPQFYDAKYPKHETAVLKFLKDFAPHYLIWGGDQLDLDCISIHTRGKPKLTENLRLSDDYEGFNILMDTVDKHLKSVEKKVMLEGNHEYFVRHVIEEWPQLTEGIIEVPNALNLKSRGYTWVERRHAYRVGKLWFIHGDFRDAYIPAYHAKAISQLYNRSIVYGHFHSCQGFVNTSPIDSHSTLAQSIGTLGAVNPHWMRNKPNAWINQFAVFFSHPNGDFNLYPVTISDGRFVFDGVMYK